MSAVSRLKDLTRPTGEEDLLDVDYPAPRWSISPRHAAWAAGAVLAVVVAWLLLRPGTDPEPADTLAPGQPVSVELNGSEPVGAGLSGLPTMSGGEGNELVVSVVGEVAEPGLVTLTPGARVADALSAARPLPEAELIGLNQAQRLGDGQQLVVPAAGEPDETGEPGASGGSGPVGTAGVGGQVSLNSATVAELTTLDGVGEKTAQAIIAHREATGGFTDVEQLMDVKGIGPAKFDALQDRVGL